MSASTTQWDKIFCEWSEFSSRLTGLTRELAQNIHIDDAGEIYVDHQFRHLYTDKRLIKLFCLAVNDRKHANKFREAFLLMNPTADLSGIYIPNQINIH